ncbi:MAG TPA: malto-oligosyltrehalose synthase, partial [Mycobacteriales bacterium]|nr:malto-oligosyltrehalose synthase [Mycobacteriales bacterium]
PRALPRRQRLPPARLPRAAGSRCRPLEAGGRAVAFVRGDAVVTVAPVRAVAVERSGWGDDAVDLPRGGWRDVLTGATRDGGRTRLAELLDRFPVAVLVSA